MSTAKRVTPASFNTQAGVKKARVDGNDRNFGAQRRTVIFQRAPGVGGKFCEQEPFVVKDEGDTLFGFGTHKGKKTFREVYYSEERSYYDFIKSIRDPDANMMRFLKWVQREKGETPTDESPVPVARKKGPPSNETVFQKGKHWERKFIDVFFDFPDYIEWARARPDGATGELKEFLDWTDDFIESLCSPSRRHVSKPEIVDVWNSKRVCNGAVAVALTVSS